jgi:tight adherence protein B
MRALLWAGQFCIGFAVVWSVLAFWDRGAVAARRLLLRYRAWAELVLSILHSRLTVHNLVMLHLGLVLVGAWAGWALAGTATMLIGVVAGALALPMWLRRAVRKRRQLLDQQLAVAIDTIGNNMLVTYNLADGFAVVARQLLPPVSQEAEDLVKDLKVGARMEEALANLAARCQSRHVDMMATALRMSLTTGGDVAAVLRQIAHLVRETMRIDKMLASKMSSANTSAWFMASIPPLLVWLLNKLKPDLMSPLWTDPLGTPIITVAVILDLVGVIWLVRLSRIDI